MGDFQFHCDLLCIWMPILAETQDMGDISTISIRQEGDRLWDSNSAHIYMAKSLEAKQDYRGSWPCYRGKYLLP